MAVTITTEKFVGFVERHINMAEVMEKTPNATIGIGNTENIVDSIYQLTQEKGIGFCKVDLATADEKEFYGELVLDKETNLSTRIPNKENLPDEERDGERGVLVLENFTSGKIDNIRMACNFFYQTGRNIYDYELPQKWIVVAIGPEVKDDEVMKFFKLVVNRSSLFRIE